MRLGVHDILAPIGEGGMGLVNRARDTKLSRDVGFAKLLLIKSRYVEEASRVQCAPGRIRRLRLDVKRGEIGEASLEAGQPSGPAAAISEPFSSQPDPQALRARTAGRSAGVGRRRALAGSVTTATVLTVMSKNSTE